jgi:rod shape-determining protein MreB
MILERLDALSKTVAVDLGTAYTRVWVKGQGLVAEHPSFLAVDTTSQRVLAIGQDARSMSGRVAANVRVLRPIQKGQLWDLAVAKVFLQAVLKDILGKSFFSPTLLLSVPAGLSQAVEDETVQLGYSLGAREVLTVAAPLAAAIGAGMPVADASGGFILQLGAGLAEAAVASLGSLVGVESSPHAGEQFEQAVILALQDSAQVTVSSETAGRLIEQLVFLGEPTDKLLLVTGKQAKSGAPQEIQVTAADLREPAEQMARSYVQLVKKLLTKVPTELTVDIVDKGLLLSGGGAKLAGLEEYLVPKLGVPVSVVDDPERAVIRGMGIIIDHLDEFRRSLSYQG